MPLWILATVFAAFFQNARFMLQRHLKATQLSTGGATFARFLFGAPLAALGLALYAWITQETIPALSPKFWAFAAAGGVSQIVATGFVVALLAQRNFTVGIALKKSEVILTALVGLVLLGEGLAPLGIIGVAIGFVGVILLSDPPKSASKLPWRKRIFNAASGYGLGSGLLFGISATGYRGATLELASSDPIFRALVTLAIVTALQTLAMSLYLRWREGGEITRVLASWRISSLVGLTSILGSFGWFTAFAVQNAGLVKALGQVELIFTFLGSYFIFKERSSTRELIGIALLVVSILAIIAAGR
ncbi:MAG: DMT family transporter [Pseudomonadota bacterium]